MKKEKNPGKHKVAMAFGSIALTIIAVNAMPAILDYLTDKLSDSTTDEMPQYQDKPICTKVEEDTDENDSQ